MSSAVAGILDPWGGIRIVVTEIERMHHHVANDELCFIVPDPKGGDGVWQIEEPVPYDRWPIVVKTVELYIDYWMSTRNDPRDLQHPCITAYQIRRAQGQKRTIHIPDLVPRARVRDLLLANQ